MTSRRPTWGLSKLCEVSCRNSIHKGFTGWCLHILYSAEKSPYFTHFSRFLSFISAWLVASKPAVISHKRHAYDSTAGNVWTMHQFKYAPSCERKRTSKKKSRCSNSSYPCTLHFNIWILSFTPWWPMKTFFTITKKAWCARWKRFLTFDCLDIACNVVDNLGRNLLKNESS